MESIRVPVVDDEAPVRLALGDVSTPLAGGVSAPEPVILGIAGPAPVWRMHQQLDRDELDRTLTPVQCHAE